MDFARGYKISINPIGLVGPGALIYTKKVHHHLDMIHSTKVGRTLLDCIRFHGLSVEISPYTGSGCNSGGGWNTVAGQRRGYANYSPDTFGPHGACTPAVGTSARLGQEILFHELIHAFRGVSGKWTNQPNLTRYENTEEFLAVFITNIFISDKSNKTRSSLRADHSDFKPLAADFSTPFSFFESSTLVLPLVKQFIVDNHGLATMLANRASDAPFNPISDFYASPDRAEEASKKAVVRDLREVGAALSAWTSRVFH